MIRGTAAAATGAVRSLRSSVSRSGSMQPASRQGSPAPTGAGARGSSPVLVASYNVLTPQYCNFSPDNYGPDAAQINSAELRFARLERKLAPMLDKGAVLCFQEMSTAWHAKLRPILSRANYETVFHRYGWWRDGYWGVMVAFPRSRYTLVGLEETCVSDQKKWSQAPRPGLGARTRALFFAFLSLLTSLLSYATFGKVQLKAPTVRDPYADYFSAKSRSNFATAVQLAPTAGSGSPFWVATYHMPCSFESRLIMCTHVGLFLGWAQRVAGGAPLICAGDFNLQEGTDEYRLATTGLFDERVFASGQPPGDSWRPRVNGMRSALAVALGQEPPFTNFAHNPLFNNTFKGTIDYIFLSQHWNVHSGAVHLESPPDALLPNLVEPSDHAMISTLISRAE